MIVVIFMVCVEHAHCAKFCEVLCTKKAS
jgi:hypothetical protein